MKIGILFLLINLNVTSSVLENVRNNFPIIESLEQVERYLEALEKKEDLSSKGYFAAMLFMKSKFVKFPLTKFSYFKKGKSKLDGIIMEFPANIELRYIRFMLQSEMPNFLGYNNNIEEDFKLIINGMLSSNNSNIFKVKMLNNMLLISNITGVQSEKIKNLINTL